MVARMSRYLVSVLDWWPVISGTVAAGVVVLSWLVTNRVRTDARLQVLEEKVKALFQLWNSREKR